MTVRELCTAGGRAAPVRGAPPLRRDRGGAARGRGPRAGRRLRAAPRPRRGARRPAAAPPPRAPLSQRRRGLEPEASSPLRAPLVTLPVPVIMPFDRVQFW